MAVDAGGTKADFLLADNTSELARARVDSIKTLTTRPELAEASFKDALHQLERVSGISMRQITRTCIGASGLSIPSVAAWIRAQHAKHIAGELLLCGDEEIAFDAAFGQDAGVLALAGTGSNVIGRTPDGRWVRAGGWGPVLGDEGSGHWIGLEAVRAIFHGLDRAADRNATTMLEQAVLKRWLLESRDQLIQQGNSVGPAKFAELTPVVVECALVGDETARGVLQRSGETLAELVALVIRNMQPPERDRFEVPEIAVAGSILESVADVRQAMIQALQRNWPEIKVRPETAAPLLGALQRARMASR